MNKKSCFYVAYSVHRAVIFIKVNTDWIQTSPVTFVNGDEHITVISRFDDFRGRAVDKVYIDHSFSRIRDVEWIDFKYRFHSLGISPVIVKEAL